MQEDDDELNEYAARAMTIWQSCSHATNEFVMRLGEQVLAFAKDHDLTTDEIAAHLGRLAGTLSVTAVRSNPDDYEAASEEYLALAVASLELAAALILDKHDESRQPTSQSDVKGPTNG